MLFNLNPDRVIRAAKVILPLVSIFVLSFGFGKKVGGHKEKGEIEKQKKNRERA